MNAYEIAGEIFNATNGVVKDSHYVQVGNALVRVSNHLPVLSNILAYNEGVERVLLILTDSSLENEAEDVCDMMGLNGIDASYTICESSDDLDYVKMKVDKFLAA